MKFDNDEGFDRACRRAFARVEAPEGFAGRVLARLPARRRKPRALSLPPWAAAAAMLLISLAGAGLWQVQRAERQRAERESARRELGLAMQITQEKLANVRARVQRDLWTTGGTL